MKWLLFSLLTGFAASCGQQGPLYLPEDTPADSQVLGGYRAVGLRP